ncbi:putative ABC transport system substrate-binding protein [Rhizobiales bacterium GAS188]|nr:putative ABC transport system substrate-binding protein [Rhizobiales bacterium GAS188]
MSVTRRGLAAGAFACLGLSVAAPAVMAEPIHIGIAQWGRHPQLDAVNTSFRAELAKQGLVEGKDVVFDWEVANFDASILPQILNKLKSSSPKLIMTISTPVAQSAKQSLKGAGIPIVFAAITDPIKAKLVTDWEHGADDMTGSSDQQNADSIIDFTRKLIPGIKKLGVLYNPGEDNNLSVVERLKTAGKSAGVEIVEAGCDNAADIPIRVATLKGRAEAVFVPSGGMMQPAIPAISASAGQISLPIINSSAVAARDGLVLAGYEVNYEEVGREAGAIAAKILKGAKTADIPPVRVGKDDFKVLVSDKQLKKLNLTLPAGLADCKCVVE